MDNRRKDGRIGLPAVATLEFQGRRLIGILRDISTHGANFATYEMRAINNDFRQLTQGAEVSLDIYGVNLSDLKGHVRQGKNIGCGMSYGIEFGDLKLDDRQSLDRLSA